MTLLENMYKRKSIRKFKKVNISNKMLERFISAASHAASAGNLQDYSVIITKDEINQRKLHKIHLEQPMVLNAPVILTFCVDVNRNNQWLNQQQVETTFNDFFSFIFSVINTIIFSQTVSLIAESEGLGTCYLETTLRELDKLSDLFELPKEVVPIISLVLGYPDEDPELRNRLPYSSLFHYEKYSQNNNKEVIDIFSKKAKEDLAKYMRHDSFKKIIEEQKIASLAEIILINIKSISSIDSSTLSICVDVVVGLG